MTFRTPFLLLALTACATDPVQDDEPKLSGEILFQSGSVAEEETARTLAGAYLSPVLRGHHLSGLENLRPTKFLVEDGQAHLRVQQTLGGVPVFGGEAIVVMDATGGLESLVDKLVPDLDVDTTPTLTGDDALEIAVQETGDWSSLTREPKVDLYVLRTPEGSDHLVYRVELQYLGGPTPTAPVLFLDAHTGEEVWRLSNIRTVAGTGTSNYSGTVDLKVYKPAGDTYYYLEDPARNIGTFTMDGGESSAYYIYDTNTTFTETWQREGVDAHYAAAAVYDYYDDEHSWEGLDDAGGPGTVESLDGTGSTLIALYVNYSTGYANAFWTGYEMVFGDGDGFYFDPLTTVDITGHEMTHGVTSYTAGFTYYGESGALDEGISDIFGSMVERKLEGESADTWLMAEDCFTPGTAGDAMRDLAYPSSDGYTVDHYDDFYCDSSDYCGVHANMGIPMLAFYLLSEGGDHPVYGGTAMTGIGADYAEKIVWKALKGYMTSSTDMADARNAWLNAAEVLHGAGTANYKAVMNAWSLVGVGVSASTSICTGYTKAYSGELSSGASKYYAKSAGASYPAGNFKAKVDDNGSGVDFDLYLQQYDGTTWKTVAKSITSGSGDESLTYAGTAGTYRMRIKSTSGTGEYVGCFKYPI